MLNPRPIALFLFVFALLGGACSSPVQRVPDSEVPPPKPAPPRPAETSLFIARDTELFYSALSRLAAPSAGQASADDYAKARSDFETLLKTYPKTKWRTVSEEFIALIDGITVSRQLVEKSLAEKSRIAQENEQLKRQVRLLNEKLQTETAALAQENEQLKKDIQTLKKLEIELDKRDRKLR